MRLAVFAPLIAGCLGFLALPTADVGAAQGDRWSVSRENVNVRAGPSTNAEVVMTINSGEVIVELAAKGDWFFVEFPKLNKQGWIYGPLLDPPSKANSKAEAPKLEPLTTSTTQADTSNSATRTVAPAKSAPTTEQATAATSEPVSEPATEEVEAPASVQTAAVGREEEPAAVKSFRETVVELNDRAVSVAGINLFTDVRSTGGGGVQVLATETWTSVPEAGQSSYMNALFERWQSMAGGLGPLALQIVDPDGNVVMERSGP